MLTLGLVAFGIAACSDGPPAPRSGTAGSTSAPVPTTATATQPTAGDAADLDCEDPVAVDAAVPASYEELAGAVALPTSRSSAQALGTSPSAEGLVLFAKTGLLIRSGAAFTISPAPEWRGRAAMWWGNTGGQRIAASFRGGPCAGSGWLAFPGGFYATEPGCIPFDVTVGGTAVRVEVGVGAACPGQRSPDAPGDAPAAGSTVPGGP